MPSQLPESHDVIIKYTGDIGDIQRDFPDVTFRVLLANYAIASIPLSLLRDFVYYPDIINVEVAEPVFFGITSEEETPFGSDTVPSAFTPVMPVSAVCADSSEPIAENLTGEGVLIGIIDSGIDTGHPAFLNPDGSSRIAASMDMNGSGNIADTSGHGTAVAGIAGGYSGDSEFPYQGIAPGASFIIVKLRTFGTSDFSLTSSLMEGIDFIVRTAIDMRMPCALNISYGTQAGAHNGQSILETYLDAISDIWQLSIICGTGNDGDKALHVSGNISRANIQREVLRVGRRQTDFSFSMWKDYPDEIVLRIIAPNGQVSQSIRNAGTYRFEVNSTTVNLLVTEPRPYENIQEYFFSFSAENGYIEPGEWDFEMIPVTIKAGTYCFWLSGGESLAIGTEFVNPDTSITLTIPSTALKVVSVGAYDSSTMQYAPFSGQGFTWQNRYLKPDLAAPGVNLLAPAPQGGYRVVSGTSFAAPMVTGAAALLLEWGIVRQNDPFLYAEKLRAFLQRGAVFSPATYPYEKYPNERLGYGLLCINNSLPDRETPAETQ